MSQTRAERADAAKRYRSLREAVAAGALTASQTMTAGEALLLGLINQGIRHFIGIFGHGTTELGEVMRIYQERKAIQVYSVHNEVEAAHIASALRWHYGHHAAVFTSIGPGALQAAAGSLTALSNGLGLYFIVGDETTHDEGPNMQQIPRREQGLFQRLFSALGPSYTLHTPEALFTALKRGTAAVHAPAGESPFYLLFPMNIQPVVMKELNLLEIPERSRLPAAVCASAEAYREAAEAIAAAGRICIKTGGGARGLSSELLARLLDKTGGVYLHAPRVPGLYPPDDPRNLGVGGSKGSIGGNYAMAECDLLIAIGARGVCQWDSSGTGFPKVREIININSNAEDLHQYNRTLPLPGDATEVISRLLEYLTPEDPGIAAERRAWQQACFRKKEEWQALLKRRCSAPALLDMKWNRKVLPLPTALRIAIDFADQAGAVKYFDAGDVQASGFQLTRDKEAGRTFTDTGASYMGFAVSALLASAMAQEPDYPIAFSGDGSFLMNPQILHDAAQYKLKGMILLFDNRRMGAISSLQRAQYGVDFSTDDEVAVDYPAMARAFPGIRGFSAVEAISEPALTSLLKEAAAYKGVSLVHIPVYYGEDERSSLGAYGRWNVGSWCSDTEREKHRIGL